MGKSHKDKITRITLEDKEVRKPRKPRVNGAGFHSHHSEKRLNTRSAQIRADLEDEEDDGQYY